MSGNARKGLGHFYACKVRNGVDGKAGCGAVACSGPPVDRLVTEWAKQRTLLSTIDVFDDEPWPREDELADARQQMAVMVEEIADAEGLARRLLNATFTRLSDQVEVMRAERGDWIITRGKRLRHAQIGPETFDAMPVQARRAHIREELTAVFVKPATTRGNRFDYSRLVPVWREAEESTA